MKTNTLRRLIRAVLPVASLLLAGGCAMMGGLYGPKKSERSSSLVDFLYPDKTEPVITPAVPVLRLPLRVGLAFVPAGHLGQSDFSEARKTELLQAVAGEFKAYPFVQSIEVIPSGYLRAGGGFPNLDQVRTLLGVDVVVLLSYDQVQFSDENKRALAYWTIVGAYFFKGNKNDTHTLMEAVVYDIGSRKLLFRAPGVNHTAANTTLVQVRERLRSDSAESFSLASADLTKNLKTELEAFRERLKKAPDEVRIEHRAGYNGAGVTEAWMIAVLLLVGLGHRWLTVRR